MNLSDSCLRAGTEEKGRREGEEVSIINRAPSSDLPCLSRKIEVRKSDVEQRQAHEARKTGMANEKSKKSNTKLFKNKRQERKERRKCFLVLLSETSAACSQRLLHVYFFMNYV